MFFSRNKKQRKLGKTILKKLFRQSQKSTHPTVYTIVHSILLRWDTNKKGEKDFPIVMPLLKSRPTVISILKPLTVNTSTHDACVTEPELQRVLSFLGGARDRSKAELQGRLLQYSNLLYGITAIHKMNKIPGSLILIFRFNVFFL